MNNPVIKSAEDARIAGKPWPVAPLATDQEHRRISGGTLVAATPATTARDGEEARVAGGKS